MGEEQVPVGQCRAEEKLGFWAMVQQVTTKATPEGQVIVEESEKPGFWVRNGNAAPKGVLSIYLSR
jgi:hypothetical protein